MGRLRWRLQGIGRIGLGMGRRGGGDAEEGALLLGQDCLERPSSKLWAMVLKVENTETNTMPASIMLSRLTS